MQVHICMGLVYPLATKSCDNKHVVRELFTLKYMFKKNEIRLSDLVFLLRKHSKHCYQNTFLCLPIDFDIYLLPDRLNECMPLINYFNVSGSNNMMHMVDKSYIESMKEVDTTTVIKLGAEDNNKVFYFYLFSDRSVDIRGDCIMNHPTDWLCGGCNVRYACVLSKYNKNHPEKRGLPSIDAFMNSCVRSYSQEDESWHDKTLPEKNIAT